MNLEDYSDSDLINMIAHYHKDVDPTRFVKAIVVDCPPYIQGSTLFKITGVKPYYLVLSVENNQILEYFKKRDTLAL